MVTEKGKASINGGPSRQTDLVDTETCESPLGYTRTEGRFQ